MVKVDIYTPPLCFLSVGFEAYSTAILAIIGMYKCYNSYYG